MLVTTFLMTLIIIIVWRKHFLIALLFLVVFGSVETLYVSSVLFKTTQGGWVPLVIAAVCGTIMFTWHYGTLKRYEYEIQNKISVGWLLGLGPSLGLVRVPGIGLMYTDLAHGVPPLFSHFVTNLPAIHSTLVFVCIKYLPVNIVPPEERFLIRRIGTKAYSMYRCAARYGYKDVHKKDEGFEQALIDSLTAFIRYEALQESDDRESLAASWTPDQTSAAQSIQGSETELSTRQQLLSMLRAQGTAVNSLGELTLGSGIDMEEISTARSGTVQSAPCSSRDTQEELSYLNDCKDAGVVYILGNNVIKARKDSGFWKKFAIDYVYTFLRRSCRESRVVLNIPHECLLQVGMIYYV